MYSKAVHSESELAVIHDFIRENPLGLFITALPSSTYPTIQCTYIPWIIDSSNAQTDGEVGVLRGHMARVSQQAKVLAEAASAGPIESEVSVVFTSPVQSYVTPKFYTETKPKTAKVAPTWNYASVQIYGKLTVYHDGSDPSTGAFLQTQLEDLSKHAEEDIMGFEKPWKVSDAPTSYVDALKKAIVGVEIKIDRVEGKFKMSQEVARGDRRGVIEGFDALGTEMGGKMARLVEEREVLMDKKAKS